MDALLIYCELKGSYMLKKVLLLLIISALTLSPAAHAGWFSNAVKAAEARVAQARAEAAKVAARIKAAVVAAEKAAQAARAEAARVAAARAAKAKAARIAAAKAIEAAKAKAARIAKAAKAKAVRIAAAKAIRVAKAKAARIAAAKAIRVAKAKAVKVAAAAAKAAAAALIAQQEATKNYLENKLGVSFDFIDEGDYGPLKVLANLVTPPAANNPVNAQLENEMSFMNFNKNPSNHNDKFNPKGYHQWQVVTLDGATTGAQCADGSDYQFLVKRSALSSNMVVFFEAGGGCWDHGTCSNSSGGFTNAGLVGGQDGAPEILGVSTDKLGIRAAKLASLTTASIQPGFLPKYQNWTRVFLPYCTQDIHLGMEDGDITYYENQEEQTGESVDVRHGGMSVQGSVLTWLKDNLEQPGQLLVTGQSAGGFASELLYHPYRLALNPKKGYMLNDAGPIMPAIQGEDAYDYPSQFAHETVTAAWNVMPYLEWLEDQSASYAHFDPENMGSISNFLASRWHNDRFALAAAQKDNVIAGFSYNTFFSDIYEEDSLAARDELRDELRLADMDRKRAQLDAIDNYGYFMPGYRPFMGGHVLTFPFIYSSTTNEDDSKDITDTIHNLMGSRGDVMKSWEYDLAGDLAGRHYGKVLDDCINYYFDFSGGGRSSGDVFLHADGEDTNWGEIIIDVFKGDTCLKLGAGPISIQGAVSNFLPDF
ncbi:hypothetical protein A9Q81_14880 [Gammaproteobacteria bacterium 42_54_T18]|nr:hypothetical protein A9Q81_14880 [Gammaproteobacteria bacterium 42_54_T18]